MNNSKREIFVVDDIQENIQVLGNILIENGFSIHVARSGEQALKGITAKKPDLILLDVSMPQMDGFEVCRRLKENGETEDIPVIFLTARTETDDIVQGFGIGAVDYVIKPFNSEELLARVNTHLELKEARDIILRQNKELQLKNDELYKMSITDKLTQVYNRLYLMEILKKDYSRSKRHLSDISCIILDIDHFKDFNDRYGHLTGDFVLKETAGRINEVIRAEDCFGRYGGEEFMAILPEIGIDEAYTVAEKFRKVVESSRYSAKGKEVSVSISLGLSSLKANAPENEEELMLFADTALYQAKAKGRNCTVRYGGSGE